MANSLSDLLRNAKDVTSIDEVATYEILGEDPNCDFGGYHIQPSLGFYNGSFRDVATFALSLPRFVTWGGGGSIRKIKITKLTANKVNEMIDARNKEFQRQQYIEAEQRKIQREIDALTAKKNSLK